MKRRLLVRLFLLIAIAITGFVFIAWWTAPNNVTSMDHFGSIRFGQSDKEVVEQLGTEGADGTMLLSGGDELANIDVVWFGMHQRANLLRWKEWRAEDNQRIAVGFGNGRVAMKASFLVVEDWPARIRRWFGLTP